MKWLENLLEGFIGSISGPKVNKLDLTEVSKGMAEQLVNKPAESVLVNGKRVSDPRVVEAVKRSRREAIEARKHVDPLALNYGAIRRSELAAAKRETEKKDGMTVKWHVGIAVKGSGDVRRDVAEARARLIEKEDDWHNSEHRRALQKREKEEARRRAAQLEEARKLEEAQAEAAELEAIGLMAVAEVDSRYNRF